MKQNIIVMALVAGAINMSQAVNLSSKKTLDEIKEMYNDPEYGNTWRWTETAGGSHRDIGAQRYVDEDQWVLDAPPGYVTV